MGYVCGIELEELPYWETINLYLEKVPDQELQEMICKLVKHLLRSRAFESARIRGRYWQVIVDGTQLASSRKELDGGCLYRIHHRGTEEEYREYYYYVLSGTFSRYRLIVSQYGSSSNSRPHTYPILAMTSSLCVAFWKHTEKLPHIP